MVAEPEMLQGQSDAMYSGLSSTRSEFSGSHVTRNKEGVPIWSGDQASFEEYVESCLMYEQTEGRRQENSGGQSTRLAVP